MKRTDLKALGLTDEQIQSIMDAYEKDIEKFKDDKAKITTLERQLETSKTTIADLTEKAKNNVSQDDFKTQLENLKTEY